MSNELEPTTKNKIKDLVLGSPWRNVYWFARILINGDKYGAIGKDSSLLLEICLGLKKIISDKSTNDGQKIELSKNYLKNILDARFSKQSGRSDRIQVFYNDVSQKLETTEDILAFILAAEQILVPINVAM